MIEDLCPYCGKNLPNRAFFCPKCLNQVRCKNCDAILEPNALGCVMCGTPLSDSKANMLPTSFNSVQEPRNTIKLEKTRGATKLDIRLTDHAADSMGAAVLGLAIGETLVIQPQHERVQARTSENQIGRFSHADGATTFGNEQQVEQIPLLNAVELPSETNSTLMERIFRRQGDRLILDDTRLKASSRADAARRLTYLFVYAHLVMNERSEISRDEWKEVLKDVELYDSNSTKALIEKDFTLADDVIRLRATGRETAEKYMADVLNADITGSFVVGSAPRGRSPRTSANAENESKKTSGVVRRGRLKSDDAEKWATAWKQLDTGIDGHRLLVNASNVDRGLVGLWAIREVVSDNKGKHVSRGNIAKFLYEAFVIKVDSKSIERALCSDDAKDKALRISGSTFEITPTGLDYVEGMVKRNERSE